MSSAVDICNLALSHLGDEATVASIDPPEQSAQGEHCARFYPMARDALLDMHYWSFATTRKALNKLTDAPLSGWSFAYQLPSNAMNIIGIVDPGSVDDYSPRAFEIETLSDGTGVLYSNTDGAICRYTMHVIDPTRFPPAFVDALSWLLASMLAGPILKGQAGAAAASSARQFFERVLLPAARQSDAAQRMVKPTHTPSWMSGR